MTNNIFNNLFNINNILNNISNNNIRKNNIIVQDFLLFHQRDDESRRNFTT